MRKSRFSQYQQYKLIELIVAGVTVRITAYYFHRFRLLNFKNNPQLKMFDGEIEPDGSYLWIPK